MDQGSTEAPRIQSLPLRLASSVFRRYVVVAFVLTIFQLGVDLASVSARVSRDLASIANVFQPSLSRAVWEMNDQLIASLASGVASAPSVSGVSVTDENGNLLAKVGDIDTLRRQTNTLAAHSVVVPLRLTLEKRVQELGSLVVFSAPDVTFSQLEASSYVLLINSTIRVIALWTLFKGVFRRGMSQTLAELTGMVARLRAVARDPNISYTPLVYPVRDELGRLVEATNELQKGLIDARREAQSILRDLHDGLGAQIVSARLRILDGNISQHEVAELLAECTDELYALVDVLNSNESGMEEALVNFRSRCVKKAPHLSIRLDLQYPYGALPAGDPATVIQIIRILQEAFTNCLKHAEAKAIEIAASLSEDALRIAMADDGVGFPEAVEPGRGLNNMRRRAREIGASLDITRQPRGTCVELIIGLDRLTHPRSAGPI